MDNGISSIIFNQDAENMLKRTSYGDRLGEICVIFIKTDDVDRWAAYEWMIECRTKDIFNRLTSIYKVLDKITGNGRITDYGEIGESWIFETMIEKPGIRVCHKYWDYKDVIAFRVIVQALCTRLKIPVAFINEEK
jgi:hypothetical protein